VDIREDKSVMRFFTNYNTGTGQSSWGEAWMVGRPRQKHQAFIWPDMYTFNNNGKPLYGGIHKGCGFKPFRFQW